MPTISATPLDARLDEPIAIEVSGVRAGAHVQLQVRNHTLRAEAIATFVASERATVNVATDAPIEGDYEGIEPAGLFWSARFDAGSDAATLIAALSSLEPLAYTATARVDEADTVQVDFTRTLLAPHVHRTPVRDGRLRGTLFTPKDAAHAPAVVVLGGSDGGDLYTFVAAMLAAHGMTTLSLAYFGLDDLPPNMIEIPVEYFIEAVAWLKARTGADDRNVRLQPERSVRLQPDRPVGILGFSRGAEAALLTAANCPDIRAVVALAPGTLTGGGISGSDFTAMAKPAWTFEGQPLPLLPPAWDAESMKDAQEAFATGKPLAARPGILRSLDAAGSRVEDVAIRIEQTRGAILLMSGEDDQLWPSSRFAELGMQRLKSASFPHPFEHRRYPDAGHFACLPPNLPARTAAARHALIPMSFAFGGSARGNAAASADLWPRIVEFLHAHLASREP